MSKEDWYPTNTKYNIYNQPSFDKPKDLTQNNDKIGK